MIKNDLRFMLMVLSYVAFGLTLYYVPWLAIVFIMFVLVRFLHKYSDQILN